MKLASLLTVLYVEGNHLTHGDSKAWYLNSPGSAATLVECQATYEIAVSMTPSLGVRNPSRYGYHAPESFMDDSPYFTDTKTRNGQVWLDRPAETCDDLAITPKPKAPGSTVCVYLSQNFLDDRGLTGLLFYEVDTYKCVDVQVWNAAARNGVFGKIKTKATGNCAQKYMKCSMPGVYDSGYECNHFLKSMLDGYNFYNATAWDLTNFQVFDEADITSTNYRDKLSDEHNCDLQAFGDYGAANTNLEYDTDYFTGRTDYTNWEDFSDPLFSRK
jgi:hypothetical protein